MLWCLDVKTPLLDRRGAETNERSEFVEAGWWSLIPTSLQINCFPCQGRLSGRIEDFHHLHIVLQ